MGLILRDRVRETTNVSGTADAVLLGAVTGFQAFSVVGDTNTCYYTIVDNQGNWETGIGTYSISGPTLARTTVLESSAGGAKVSFPAGTKDVFLTYPAEKSVNLDESGYVDAAGSGNVTLNGNLTFNGTARRITGDFSNATLANRVSFQTSTTNGDTNFNIIPNGTSVISGFQAFNNATPTNASVASFFINSTDARVISGISGTGTYLPLTFYTNGNERVRIDTSGNVGIGTATPSARLTVNLNSSFAGTPSAVNGGLHLVSSGNDGSITMDAFAANAQITFRRANGTLSSPTALTSGNVIGAITFRGYGDTGYASGNRGFIQLVASENWTDTAQGTYWQFNTVANGTVSSTEKMRIDNAGNVGIGTSSPVNRLNVSFSSNNGDGIRITNSSQISQYLSLNMAGSTGFGVPGWDNSGIVEAVAADVGSGTRALYLSAYNGPIIFGTNERSERMRITSAGDVGIGTSSPGYKLHVVKGSAGVIANFSDGVAQTLTIGTDASGVKLTNDNSGYIAFANTAERMRIDSSGNVAIGSTNPRSSRLYLENAGSSGAPQLMLVDSGDNTKQSEIRFDSGSLIFDYWDGGGNRLERMRIGSTGNVGIGVVSQSDARLAVYPGSTTGVVSARFATNTTDGTAYNQFVSGVDSSELAALIASSTYFITAAKSGSYLGYSIGGSERMRIDSSGNVGIGISSPSFKLDVVQNANFPATVASQNPNSGVSATARFLAISDGGNAQIAACSTGYTDVTGASDSMMLNASNMSNGIVFAIDGVIRAKLDSSGNLGIGTSSPYNIVEANTSGGATIGIANSGSGADILYGKLAFYSTVAAGAYKEYGGQIRSYSGIGIDYGDLRFYTGNGAAATERMRITSGGEVYIAGTTDQGAFNLQCNGTGVWGAGAYTNGSDERIKEDIAPIESGLDVVQKLNPVTYRYKEDWSKDQSTQTGFVAQELLVALEGKNYVDGVVQQGGEYMSVAYQNIIPILTKAIQEQQQIINDLKARIETLESK